MAKSYSSSAILKHLKAGTECACLAVFETCRFHDDQTIDFSKRAINKINAFTWPIRARCFA